MALNSPCAACKFLRRKCTQECPFAPYFPPDQPQKFSNVHKVFGASNVAKILQELNAAHREDAVTSLAFEAEARLRDPVYGCVGVISTLTTKLGHLQTELFNAKKELCNYIGPSGMGPPLLQHQPHPHQFLLQQHPTHQNLSPSIVPFAINNNPPMALGLAAPGASSSQYQLIIREQQQVQQRRDLLESQHLAAVVAREQELMRSYEQQQQQQLEQQQLEQQQELVGYNNVVGYDPGSGIVGLAGGFTNANAAGLVNPAVPVVQFDNNQFQLQQQQQQQLEERLLLHHHQQQQQHQQQPVLLLQQPQQQQRAGSEEGTSVIGPSA